MSVLYHASCACGYKSRRLGGETCLCRTCKELIDIPHVPFRYELQPCPNCGAHVPESDTLLNLLGPGYLIFGRPSALPCPQCNAQTVQFTFNGTVSVRRSVTFPAVGDEIDGSKKEDGTLEIPWFPLNNAHVEHDLSETVPAGRVRLRIMVIQTRRPTETVKSVFYRFVVTRLKLSYVRTIDVQDFRARSVSECFEELRDES